MTEPLDDFLAREAKAYRAKMRNKRSPLDGIEPAPKRRAAPEMQAQDAIVSFIRQHARQKVRVAHTRNQTTPPEAIRHDVEKMARFFAKLKRGGVEAGRPDLEIRYAPGRVEYWEIKAPKGKLSLKQREWHDDARAMGFEVRVVLNVNQAEERLRELKLLDSQQWGRPAVPAEGLR